jgi:hypothetical protein
MLVLILQFRTLLMFVTENGEVHPANHSVSQNNFTNFWCFYRYLLHTDNKQQRQYSSMTKIIPKYV